MEQENEIYGGFASVYDLFMDNIPYDEWFTGLQRLLEEYGVCDGIVVELACGTGEMTKRFAKAGYDMIGVDQSPEMLQEARQKCPSEVLLLCQDMRELDLYGSAAAMICVCDGMNYLCSPEGLQQVFHRVWTFLEEGGVFIFDMKTAWFYREVLGNRTFTDNREAASYIWENEYDNGSGVNEYLLTVYELVDDERDLFRRTDEVHRQRAYDREKVDQYLREQGFRHVDIAGDLSGRMPTGQDERVYFIAIK